MNKLKVELYPKLEYSSVTVARNLNSPGQRQLDSRFHLLFNNQK